MHKQYRSTFLGYVYLWREGGIRVYCTLKIIKLKKIKNTKAKKQKGYGESRIKKFTEWKYIKKGNKRSCISNDFPICHTSSYLNLAREMLARSEVSYVNMILWQTIHGLEVKKTWGTSYCPIYYRKQKRKYHYLLD